MSTLALRETGTDLAFEQHGDGVPVVFLHGLTFDRTTWRPIIDRLGDGVRSIAIDLPGHGATGGGPCSLDEMAARVRALVDGLGVERPVVVGHSMSGGIATVYAAAHPARGAVIVDSAPDIRPFVELVQRLESALPWCSATGTKRSAPRPPSCRPGSIASSPPSTCRSCTSSAMSSRSMTVANSRPACRLHRSRSGPTAGISCTLRSPIALPHAFAASSRCAARSGRRSKLAKPSSAIPMSQTSTTSTCER